MANVLAIHKIPKTELSITVTIYSDVTLRLSCSDYPYSLNL